MNNNVIAEKSFGFAVRIIGMYGELRKRNAPQPLANQVLGCGTSIGANVEEGIGAQTGPDFFTKLSIAYKEARETKYWLRLLQETALLSETEARSMLNDCEELLRILGAIRETVKRKKSLKT